MVINLEQFRANPNNIQCWVNDPKEANEKIVTIYWVIKLKKKTSCKTNLSYAQHGDPEIILFCTARQSLHFL